MAGRNIVGWFLPRSLEARAIWFDPVPYTWEPQGTRNSDLFLRCPARENFDRNLFVIRCPFDLHLTCMLTEQGYELQVGPSSSIRPDKLASLIKLHPRDEWREADKPLLQLQLNYYFLSDEPVDLQYLSPLATNYLEPALPGIVLHGRWGIQSWVRPVNFVFEWWDTSCALEIKRGQPLLNVLFLPGRPDVRVSLVEAEETPEVIEMARQVQNINSYIRDVFSVLPNIRARRPKRLVAPCKKKNTN